MHYCENFKGKLNETPQGLLFQTNGDHVCINSHIILCLELHLSSRSQTLQSIFVLKNRIMLDLDVNESVKSHFSE